MTSLGKLEVIVPNNSFLKATRPANLETLPRKAAAMPPVETAKKERGCFQCSRRRIVCDRTEPTCLKCKKKGIECSGLGRIRFAEGVARRGRFKDCKVPAAGGENECKDLPTTTGFQVLRWSDEHRVKKRKSNANENVPSEADPATALNLPVQLPDNPRPKPSIPDLATPGEVENCDVEEIRRDCDLIVRTNAQPSQIAPWIAPIDPKLRMLFSYCKLAWKVVIISYLLIKKQSQRQSPLPW